MHHWFWHSRMPVLGSLKTLFCTGKFIDPCINNVPLRCLRRRVGAPAFQAGDKIEMTLGFSPGVWKLGHLLCKYQIIAKQWPVTDRSSPMNMRVRRCFRALWDCLAMGRAYLNHGRAEWR